MSEPIAIPSRDDPAIAAASEWIGGPVGRRAARSLHWWSPVRIALAVASVVLALGFIADQPCRSDGWAARSDRSMWTSLCYSDVAFLYRERGFVDDQLAYRDTMLEYPVLTGLTMQVSAHVAQALSDGDPDVDGGIAEGVRFYDVTAILMALSAFVVVIATARTVRRRPWDGMFVAVSPLLLLSATINWDLLAVALAALAILAWTRERPAASGLLIGLGAATKLYPALLLGPMFLVVLRSPDRPKALRTFAVTLCWSAVAWGAVNLPAVLWARTGWEYFFTFNSDRAADFGSSWQALSVLAPGLVPADINTPVLVAGICLFALIAVLALTAAEPPRLAQLVFLAVAAFLLVNKVWSPQYTLWLLPLAVLARPRLRELAIWQAVEVGYFVIVWLYLASIFDPENILISQQDYAWAIVIRVMALMWLVALVVRDILRPENDPVRPYVDDVASQRRDQAAAP